MWIFLRRPDQSAERYIGEMLIREMPRVRGRIAFELEDEAATGTVDRLVPDSSQPASELIPTVHVVLDG